MHASCAPPPFGLQRTMGASVCYGMNSRFCNSGTEPSQMQRMSGFRQCFRRSFSKLAPQIPMLAT
ncbi:hypothetical protein Z945_3466 [Sulfitobacter noctilucae]|nr:hypothetical protein Z945_3466 [Sulfitobacter noctilucae]